MDQGQAHYIVLKELAGNQPPTLNKLQLLLEPNVGGITAVYWTLWITTALMVIYYVWKHGVRDRDRARFSDSNFHSEEKQI